MDAAAIPAETAAAVPADTACPQCGVLGFGTADRHRPSDCQFGLSSRRAADRPALAFRQNCLRIGVLAGGFV